MKYYSKYILELAKSEIGYMEKASNKNLDSKTDNAGYNNYTKYARDLYAAGYYNGNKNGYSWCDVFVDWLFYKCFGKEEGQRIECQTGLYGASCTFSVKYYKDKGRFDNNPKIGDQIFFKDSSGNPCHTGIVYQIVGSTIVTIEGNTSNKAGVVANGGCVAIKSYPKNYYNIYGYGHPLYDEEMEEYEMKLPNLKMGSKGKTVKVLQTLLTETYGYNCGKAGADGDFGSSTKMAVMNFQQDNTLDADGEVGEKTWTKLLT